MVSKTKISRWLAFGALTSLLTLILLCLCWELWLAPLRPGGSWLVLKVLPLLAPLFGMLRNKRYTFQWTSLLALAYIAEGIVRGVSDPSPSRQLAWVEIGLAAELFFSTAFFAYLTRRNDSNPKVNSTQSVQHHTNHITIED